MTGLPSAVLREVRRAVDGESRVEKFVAGSFIASNCDNGGVEEELGELVALLVGVHVPFFIACRHPGRVLPASCSRIMASSFLVRRMGSNPRDFLLQALNLIFRMTGAACVID
jgi:hypothetical protein